MDSLSPGMVTSCSREHILPLSARRNDVHLYSRQEQNMKSDQLYESAQRHLVGGAGAGGRYHPLLKRPLYLARGRGSRFWDVDGMEYIDFFTGSGANFLGHDHPAINAAIRQALEVGVICNGETEYHSRLADLVSDAVPCAEKIRLANS